MSAHHIDFVTLDLAVKDNLGLPIDDPLTELLDHRWGGGQVWRVLMPSKDGVGEVVEALPTGMAS